MNDQQKILTVGVPRETFPGERRIALTPDVIASLRKAGIKVKIEAGAGDLSCASDKVYSDKGAELASSRAELFESSDVILQVWGPGANPTAGGGDVELMHQGQTIIGFCEPFTPDDLTREMTKRGVNILSMELMPRITRAQSMDALSSMATIAGYKAVLLAAEKLPRMFPMFMTAAGTVAPAKVFVIGAGVAGLQAIATAKRLGAVVKGYDIRPAVKEQVESLGAKFVELAIESSDAEDKGGYARAMDEDFYSRQRELLKKTVAEHDVVISTAAVPGKKAPILITREMVAGMTPGSVIVDLAAERGGNCELTRPGEEVIENGVTILGPLNIPSTVPCHASQMYAKNIATFLLHLVKDGKLNFDTQDEISRETLIAQNGQIIHPRVREAFGLEPNVDSERSQS